ncbi:MAG: hypothetical protein HC880_13820, partial [Bacteroidia bacterium]|nr:hypothetical protein [Bacteroidia bacterium]
QTKSFKLPPGLTGVYQLFVLTDQVDATCGGPCVPGQPRGTHGGNRVPESDEQDNFVYQMISIFAPPAPDLQISSVGGPLTAFGGDVVSVSYTGINAGETSIQGKIWTDQVYLSNSPIFEGSMRRLLDERRVSSPLAPDSSYTGVFNIQLPYDVAGPFYFHVLADARNEVLEYAQESNNTRSAEAPIEVTLRPPADLQISNLQTPNQAQSGDRISIGWIVSNVGANAPTENRWADRVYLSPLDTFNRENAIEIGAFFQKSGNSLDIGTQYSAATIGNIPDGLAGTFYIYALTDADQTVFEFTFESNNLIRSSTPIQISQAPYPDLTVSKIFINNTQSLKDFFTVEWTIHNQGPGTTQTAWKDYIYLSADTQFNLDHDRLLGQFASPKGLASNESYTNRVTIPLPQDLSAGAYTLFIYTDAENQVFELATEDNNLISTDLLQITPVQIVRTYSDLEVLASAVPTLVSSGESLRVSWKVINQGPVITDAIAWQDRVFLSLDNQLSADDPFLGFTNQAGALSADSSYTAATQIRIPEGLSGSYFLLLVADHAHQVRNDTLRQNNILATSISIQLSSSPDLRVRDLSGPAQALAGQQIEVSYRVENQGSSAEKVWRDALYLSDSPDLSGQLVLIAQAPRDTLLAPGDSVPQSLAGILPRYASGPYYLVVKTDFQNQIYEHLGEDNNLVSTLIQVAVPLPADLIVSQVEAPEVGLLGDTIQLHYTIQNVGTNPAIGSLRNNLHFSTDQAFDGNQDPLLLSQDFYLELAPGASLSRPARHVLRDITAGSYYTLARSNTLNQIRETGIDNNVGVSTTSIRIDAEALTLAQSTQTFLNFGQYLYYKVDVAEGLDLLLNIISDQEEGLNEVYVAFNRVPSPLDFEFRNEAAALDQEILIPSTQKGTYYILLLSQTRFATPQNLEIIAQTLPFSLLSITPQRLGQGRVTSRIRGAGFRPGIQVGLRDQNEAIVAQAQVFDLISSMNLKVRWQLQDVPLGIYDLVLTNPDQVQVVLENAVTVEPVREADLSVEALNPGVIRRGRSARFEYVFENTGNVDVSFAKGEFLVLPSANLKTIDTEGGVQKRSAFTADTSLTEWIDYGGFRHIPFLAKNLGVGETFSVDLDFDQVDGAAFPIQARANPLSAPDFIRLGLSIAERVRQNALVHPELYPLDEYPPLLNLLQDPCLFMDSVMAIYFRLGILTPEDTIGLGSLCSQYEVDVLKSPSTAYYPDLVWGENERFLWEINRANGLAGSNPGWDLLRVAGPLVITSSPENPFIITIASLSSYDNTPSFLGSWGPGYNYCWPVVIASGGIQGFDPSRVQLDTAPFEAYNNLYGGTFALEQKGDTLFICFKPVSLTLVRMAFRAIPVIRAKMVVPVGLVGPAMALPRQATAEKVVPVAPAMAKCLQDQADRVAPAEPDKVLTLPEKVGKAVQAD